MRNIIASIVLTLASSVTFAATQTVTLSVPGMDCPVCPITVKKALEKVAGVKKVNVAFEAREAKVIFDDAITNTDKLVKTTRDAGYPSIVKGVAK